MSLVRRTAAAGLALIVAVAGALLGAAPASAHPGQVLYDPDPSTNADDKASYEHAIQLDDGTILATFERQLDESSDPGRGWLIYRSTDQGQTFEQVARVEPHDLPDARDALQPALTQLDQDTGDLKAGTVVLSAETAGGGGLHAQLFTSTDKGESWDYLSTPEKTHPDDDGERRIWEPYTMQLDDGRLVVYYSDEIVPGREQNIVGKVSEDGGKTWSEPFDVWNPTGTDDRPGMSTVAKMGNGRYIMTVEACGNEHDPVDYCRVHYKTSDDGLDWGDPTDWGTRPEAAGTGHVLHGNPMVTWTPSGGPNGTVIITGSDLMENVGSPDTPAGGHDHTFLVNYNNGEGEWHELTTPIAPKRGGYQSAYRNGVMPIADSDRLLFLTASHNGNDDQNRIMYGTGPTGALPYNDAFSDGTDQGWQTFGGDWEVNNNGVYSNTSGGDGEKSITGSTGWTDYTVTGEVRLDGSDSGGNAGMLLRTTSPDPGADAQDGYYVGLSAGDDGIFLGRHNHDWNQLGETQPLPDGVEKDTWYSMSATVSGCTISVSVEKTDGSGEPTTFEHTDQDCLPFGGAGVRTVNTPASWRNFAVQPTN